MNRVMVLSIREILQHVQNCSNSSTAHFPQNTFPTSQILKNTSNSNFQLPVSLKFQLLIYPGFSFRLCFTILGTQTSRQKTYNHDGKCTIPTVSAPFRRNMHHPDGISTIVESEVQTNSEQNSRALIAWGPQIWMSLAHLGSMLGIFLEFMTF